MRKTKILGVGIVLALLALMVSVTSCYPAATTSADATTTANPWTSMLPLLGFIVILFGLMYFFTIRPQRKKQQETQKMLSQLTVGDKVVTNAGIYGTIKSVSDDSFVLTTDSGSLRVAKWAVVGKQPEETAHN